MNKTQYNRADTSIQNVLRILRPVLEEKGIIGTMIKMTEFSKLCRNYKARLPVRSYRAKDLTEDLKRYAHYGDLFTLDDLEIGVYEELDLDEKRRYYLIDFHYLVSKEQQYSNSLAEQEVEA